MSLARGASEREREEISEWLNENNEFIVKSPRYEQLIDHACMFFDKKSSSQVSEDTLNFIRRSANELLRNKASKEAMRKRLCIEEDDEAAVEKVIRDNEMMPKDFDMDDEPKDSASSDEELILGKNEFLDMVKREKSDYDNANGYQEKRPRENSSMQL